MMFVLTRFKISNESYLLLFLINLIINIKFKKKIKNKKIKKLKKKHGCIV